VTFDELEKRWADFIDSGAKGIESSELRARAINWYQARILREREKLIAEGTEKFTDWELQKSKSARNCRSKRIFWVARTTRCPGGGAKRSHKKPPMMFA
jgi:hypothetical protein